MFMSCVGSSHDFNDHVEVHQQHFRNYGVFTVLLLQIVLSTTLFDIATAEDILHRINCGSTKQVIVPPNNITWAPDKYSTAGLNYNTCGNATTSIYCTSRVFRSNDTTPHRYNLPIAVSNRTYEVRLHFAENVRLIFICNIIIAVLIHFLAFDISNCSTLQKLMHAYSTYFLKAHSFSIMLIFTH